MSWPMRWSDFPPRALANGAALVGLPGVCVSVLPLYLKFRECKRLPVGLAFQTTSTPIISTRPITRSATPSRAGQSSVPVPPPNNLNALLWAGYWGDTLVRGDARLCRCVGAQAQIAGGCIKLWGSLGKPGEAWGNLYGLLSIAYYCNICTPHMTGKYTPHNVARHLRAILAGEPLARQG